jgi:2-polyprenyl-3-methyl-5-hydroxy-6-metoxy-1,4-benzoquinol methylase
VRKIALGKPAEYEDFIISRRISILKSFDDFINIKYSLIDIGCGNGGSLIILSDLFRKCHGIDIIESNLKQLSEKISEYKILNCTSNLEDIDAMEESADKYDRIVSFEVVEHVKNDFQTVRNMYTKLNVGGKIAISVPNKWWIFETHGAYLPILPWNRVPLFSWLPKFIHSRYAKARIYRKKDINKIVEHAGFKNIKIQYITAPMDVIKWKPLQSFLRKTIFSKNTTKIPFLSTSIIVYAEK